MRHKAFYEEELFLLFPRGVLKLKNPLNDFLDGSTKISIKNAPIFHIF